MTAPATSHDLPAFGQADLSNCERELIHLAGSVQPHGALLVVRELDGVIVQASCNAADIIGRPVDSLLGRGLGDLGGSLAATVQALARSAALSAPEPLQCTVDAAGGQHALEGSLHRQTAGWLVIELEALAASTHGGGAVPAQDLPPAALNDAIAAAVQRFSAAPTIGILADSVVQVFRELTGYDRVMVYKFDPDGHGKVIAEARHPRLESLLGHHYPASDIPQRARELYLRNRVRMLVDVHYQPQALVPALLPAADSDAGAPLDMSLCALRSMSPLHLQYLKNMGVTATLVCSLVREGRLWGLVAAHHYTPRRLRCTLRAAADLLAEVASTRISAIENYVHAQVALMVRRLEQRLVEATSTEGDWRYALFRNPRTLLQPLEATGAALFHDDELLTAGEVPSTPDLRALLAWVAQQPGDGPLACNAIGKAEPTLDALTPTASGVLAVRLAINRPDYLIWLRKEQLLSVTWAGNPAKPMVDDDPLELSPRRSFAAWSEIVRGTGVPWSPAEIALARAIGASLGDIIVQVQAVRMLIAEHQLQQIRAGIAGAREAVLVLDANGRLSFANEACASLCCQALTPGSEAALLFTRPTVLAQGLAALRSAPQPWRHEMELAPRQDGAAPLPVAVRLEVVNGRAGQVLGFLAVLTDLRERRRADAARQHLEDSLRQAARAGVVEPDAVVAAILTNAGIAALDIADARGGPPVAPLLEEVEASTRRAAALYAQIRSFSA